MNRLIRMILYITAGCVGVGCAALILGFALGGTDDRTQLKEAVFVTRKARDTADSIAEAVQGRFRGRKHVEAEEATENVQEGTGFEYAYTEEAIENDAECTYDEQLQDNDAYVYMYEEDDYDYDGYGQQLICVEADAVQDIAADLRHAYFGITEGEGSQIRVCVKDETDGIQARLYDGKIEISDSRKGKQSRRDASVYLIIPEDSPIQFHSLSIQNDAGVVETDCELDAGNFSVKTGAGQILLDEVKADKFTASVGAGEITIEEGNFGTTALDCGVGVITIDAQIYGDADIDCGMGVVDLELEDGADSVNYVLKCGAGHIQIDDESYSGLSRERRIDNGASALFTLNCGVGQIVIE